MDQLPKICSNCNQPNFPLAEFCRHCGEPISNLGSISKRNAFSRFVSFLIDGLFWIIDEFIRWLELARVYLTLKELQRKRSKIINSTGQNKNHQINVEEREHIVSLSEEIAKLAKREEELKRQTWALFPEIVFILLISFCTLLFFWIRGSPNLVTLYNSQLKTDIDLDSDIKYDYSVPLSGFTVIKSAVWYSNKIYIGGDGGLINYDTTTKEITSVKGLPDKFFVRHLLPTSDKLLIAGFGAIFALENNTLTQLYTNSIPYADLYNFILPTNDGGHIIGTLGYGLLKGNNNNLTLVIGTQGTSVVGAIWLDNELWVLHEYGVIKGTGLSLSPYNLYVFANKRFNKIEISENTIYLLSDDTLIIGVKAYQNWVWTPISFTEVKGLKDIIVSNKTVVIAAENGLYKYKNGKIIKLAPFSDLMSLAVTNDKIAAISPRNIYIFSINRALTGKYDLQSTNLPLIGTYISNISSNTNYSNKNLIIANSLSDSNKIKFHSNQSTMQTVTQEFNYTPSQISKSLDLQPTNIPNPSHTNLSSNNTLYNIPDELLHSKLLTSIIQHNNSLLISTSNSGLWIYDKIKWNNFSTRNTNLPDNQITKLVKFYDRIFLTSPTIGILEFSNNLFSQIINPQEMFEIKSFYVDSQNNIWFLYKDGIVKSYNKDKKLIFESRILDSFIKSAHSIYVINNEPIVICNEGILFYQSMKWIASFYPQLDVKATVSATTTSPENRTFIALSNNNVYVVEGRSIRFLASIQEIPKKIIYNQTLWAISDKNIYRFDASKFSLIENIGTDTIKDFEPLPDVKQILLITNNGIRSVNLL